MSEQPRIAPPSKDFLDARRRENAPPPPPGADYQLHWSSSTNPPVVAPLDFVAYGYGSCTAWATLLA